MRISPIFTMQQNFGVAKNKYKNPKTDYSPVVTKPMPTYKHYLSFTGGYSLSLKDTLTNLDKLSGSTGSNFPPEIRQAVVAVVESGNPKKNTLIDVHKEKYSLLNDCYDLDDARALFDEFKNVLSDTDIDYKVGSFIDRVKKGEVDNFNKDEDIAFQLLKLYWADGFSLNDLKEYAGTDLYHTLSKLQIPLMDHNYAHILKFSDKDYNARLTSQMAKKQVEARDRMAQRLIGEPVYIPRGPMSDMQKKHISDSLLKYYAQNPEMLSLMSQRQREYYANNPEQSMQRHMVMDYAWNKTHEGIGVKKHMSKFFKKAQVPFSDSLLDGSSELSSKQKNVMEDFWKKNGWAKQSFSVAVKKAWSVIQSSTDCVIKVNMIPLKYLESLKKWEEDSCISSGLDYNKIINSIPSENDLTLLQILTNIYLEEKPEVADIITSAYAAVLLKLRLEIINDNIPKNVSLDKDARAYICKTITSAMFHDAPYSSNEMVLKLLPFSKVKELLLDVMNKATLANNFACYIERYINTAYNILTSSPDKSVVSAMLQDFIYTEYPQ